MKKLYKTSFFYLILGLAMGVFYREFTKIKGYQGITMLSKIHAHLLILGFLLFLILLFLEIKYNITVNKKFRSFYIVYNIGLMLTIGTMTWRGILDIIGIGSINTNIVSGIAGIGHILLGTGLIIFMLIIKDRFLKVV
jgi:hypothetical protein